MNILVTGGSGFIGKHLIRKLTDLGHEVINLDRTKGDNLVDYSVLSNITLPIDVIYHLAAQPYGRGGEIDPYNDLDINTKATLNVYRFAEKHKIKKVIYTSTMAVYGNNFNAKETDELNPLSNYGVSKLFGEFSLKKHTKNTSTQYTIFRLWNTYGPGQDLNKEYKGLMQAMCRQCVYEDTIKVTGSLDRYRDHIYVDDVIDALILGLNPITDNDTFNISSGVKVTIEDLINTIIQVLNSSSLGKSIGDKKEYKIQNIGSHKGDQFGSVGNSQKLQSLGWVPKTPLHTGIKNFIKYIIEYA